MKVKNFYYKVSDLEKIHTWWKGFLKKEATFKDENYIEFDLNNVNLGFLLNSFNDKFLGNRAVLTIECNSLEETNKYKDFVIKNNGKVISDDLYNQNLKSITLQDPFENEFELCY